MAILPIVERELRVALRKRRPVRSRLLMAGGCAAGALLLILLASVTGSRGVGRSLHQIFCIVGLSVVLRTPRLTAGIFAEERRNQTLGLLFLSGLSASEVFISKVFSAAMIAFTDLLAMVPLLALPFLIGGVSFDLFLATLCALPSLLLCALAVSLLASVLTQDDGTAVILATVLGVLLCAVTPAIYLAQSQLSVAARPSLWWLRLSPAYGPFLVWTGFRSGTIAMAEFWRNLPVTMVWSGLCLSGAAVALKLLWRERDENTEKAPWRKRLHEMVHGDENYRRGLAASWLESNPFVWLAGRDRQPAILAWLVVGGISLIWLLCWAAWPQRWLNAPNLMLTAALLNLALRWIIRFTAARGVGEPRREGSYELLLTTPLNPSDIVWGELEALRWHFQTVTRAVLALHFILMLAGLLVRDWNERALYVYFVIWACLIFWAWSQGRHWRRTLLIMWASLNCGRPAHAVWRATGNRRGWMWMWIAVIQVPVLAKSFAKFPTGSGSEIFVVSVVGVFFLVLRVLRHEAAGDRGDEWEHRLIWEFREIVREPLPDPADSRFKKWDVRERYPWGWSMVQQQLHERVARRQKRVP